jgi:hypothetical protein
MRRSDASTAERPAPTYPTCGGPMFDNRADKSSPKAPDFRCQRASCVGDDGRRTAVWLKDLEKPKRPAPAPTNGTRSALAAIPDVALSADRLHELCRLHAKLLAFVVERELPRLQSLGGDVAGAVSALTAQLFIAALGRTGTP